MSTRACEFHATAATLCKWHMFGANSIAQAQLAQQNKGQVPNTVRRAAGESEGLIGVWSSKTTRHTAGRTKDKWACTIGKSVWETAHALYLATRRKMPVSMLGCWFTQTLQCWDGGQTAPMSAASQRGRPVTWYYYRNEQPNKNVH
jgi:hypothetical protein